MKLILSPILIVELMTLAELFSAVYSDHDISIEERHGPHLPIKPMRFNLRGFAWVIGRRRLCLIDDVVKKRCNI